MQLKLDMSCHLLNVYTKFQIDIPKHAEEKSGKRGRTDGRTDGQTDGHCHGIICPLFKRAYKNGNDNVGFLSPSVIYNGCMEISHVQDILYVIRAFLRTKALIPMVITSFVAPSEYIVNISYEDSLQKGDFTSYPKIPQYHIWKPDITHTSFLSPHL